MEWNGLLVLYFYIMFLVFVVRFMSGGLFLLFDWGYYFVGDLDKFVFGFFLFYMGWVGGVVGVVVGCLFGLSVNL